MILTPFRMMILPFRMMILPFRMIAAVPECRALARPTFRKFHDLGAGCQAACRRTSRRVPAMSSADRTSSQPASKTCMGQNVPTG